MKAKASGTPAKLEATPLKVIKVGRSQPGRPPRSAASARARPSERAEGRRGGADLEAQPIGQADRRLAEPDDVGEREGAVTVLEGADEEPRSRRDEEHRREDEERRDAEPGREIGRRDRGGKALAQRSWRQVSWPASSLIRKDGSASAIVEPSEREPPPYFATVAPTTASHCLAMISLAAFCSSSVGNFALA